MKTLIKLIFLTILTAAAIGFYFADKESAIQHKSRIEIVKVAMQSVFFDKQASDNLDEVNKVYHGR